MLSLSSMHACIQTLTIGNSYLALWNIWFNSRIILLFFYKKKTLINLLIIKQSRVNDVRKPIKEQTPLTNRTRTHKLLLCCLLRWPTGMAHLIVLFIWILLLHQYNSRIPFPNYSCCHDFVFK